MMELNPYAKAVLALLTAMAGALWLASGDGVIELQEWLQSLFVGLGSAGTVWGVENKTLPTPAASPREIPDEINPV